MANVLVENSSLTAIADAIREKLNTEDTYKPSEMANAIESISGGGSTPTGTKEISITSNGTTTENVAAYASAEITVNVPNTYSAGDDGKVVSNGALVAQTSDTVTENDTYDTTLINSLTVNVSGGGGGGLSLIDTISVSGSRSARVDISSSWFSTYDLIVIVPELTFSSSDWMYLGVDADTGNKYTTNTVSSVDERYSILLSKPISQKYTGVWLNSNSPSITVETYLNFYMYSSSKTMTGSIKIYGVSL